MTDPIARDLLDLLAAEGFDKVFGVPCSLLGSLIAEAEARACYTAASVEGEAVAMAAGAWLVGGGGVVVMQNSGLGNAVNPIASLLIPYKIPAALVVSWRGEPGVKDAAHHGPMGAATPGVLDALGVPTTRWGGGAPHDASSLRSDVQALQKTRGVGALLVSKGVFAKGVASPPLPPRAVEGLRWTPTRVDEAPEPLERVLGLLHDAIGARACVTTTGYTSRLMAGLYDAPHHFHMQGSMGFAAAIGLGMTLARPELPVAILDGDGALIMRLGTLATVGACQPERFLHIVLDNALYASTGGQPTASPGVDFAAAALACGYARAASCVGPQATRDALQWCLDTPRGPALLHIKLLATPPPEVPRPALTPAELAWRFRA